jgi:hypothetical protein
MKAQRLDRHRFRCGDVLGAAHRLVLPDDERTDAEGIAERQHAVARDHRHHGVRALAALVHAGDGAKNRVGIQPMMLRRALEFERQHIEQHLAVRIGIDVAKVQLEEFALQFLAVGQVAVVTQRHAER